MTRPEPWENPDPERFHFEAVEAGMEWRVVADPDYACRGARGCPNPTVAARKRDHRTAQDRFGFRWWHYCAEHLYGRWIEDGQVMQWRLVRNDPPDPA